MKKSIKITKRELWDLFFKENSRNKDLVGFIMSNDYKRMKRRFKYFWKKKLNSQTKPKAK